MVCNLRTIFIFRSLAFVSSNGQTLDPRDLIEGVDDLVSIENDEPTRLELEPPKPAEVSHSLRWEHCKFHRQVAMLSLAGGQKKMSSPDEAAEKSLKRVDTFYPIDCLEDYMFDHGNRFIDRRKTYKLHAGDAVINFSTRSATNVTVLHYSSIVPKKHQKFMTPQVCFDFCRHMDDMYFFGIRDGRDCYCEPFYQPMPDDSSSCDVVCEGDSKLSCGGQSKSSIFEMHSCADTPHVLRELARSLNSFLYGSPNASLPQQKLGLREYSSMLNHTAAVAGDSCGLMQQYFSKVGDVVAEELMKRCKVHASEVQYKSWEAMDLVEEGKQIKPEYGNFSKYPVVVKAEKQIATIDTLIPQVEAMASDLRTLWDDFQPAQAPLFSETLTTVRFNGTLKQEEPTQLQKTFAPAMSFVDKSVKEWMPSVCGGEHAGEPRVADERECGSLCAKMSNCVGFTHFIGVHSPICFLFSSLDSVTYYPHCPKVKVGLQPQAFLQPATSVKEPVFRARCHVKSSKFAGKSMKPDPTGECKVCFKRVHRKRTKDSLCSPWSKPQR